MATPPMTPGMPGYDEWWRQQAAAQAQADAAKAAQPIPATGAAAAINSAIAAIPGAASQAIKNYGLPDLMAAAPAALNQGIQNLQGSGGANVAAQKAEQQQKAELEAFKASNYGADYGVKGGQIGPAPATQGAGAGIAPATGFGPAPLPSSLPSPILVAGQSTPGNSIPTGPTGPASTLASNPGMSAGSGAGTMAAGSGAKLPTFGGTGTSTNSGVVPGLPPEGGMPETPVPYAPVTAPAPPIGEAPPKNPNGYDPFKPQYGVPGSATPSTAGLGAMTQGNSLISQYGQGGTNPLPTPPPSSSTASAPNSTWTGASTAALANSYNPLPQSYLGPPSGGSSFGGVGGSSGYGGGYSAPQFNAPAAPSFGGSGAAGGTTGSATPPVAPTFGTTAPTTTSSTQSSSTSQTGSTAGYGNEVLAREEAALARAGDLQYSQTGQPTTASTTTDPELAKIAEDYQKAQDAANKANEDRYAQGMQGYGDRYTRNMATEATRTNQDYADLQKAQDAALASNQQSLVNRGLGNSTIVDTTRAGINDQYAALRNRLGDSRIATKAGLDMALSGDQLKFLENRTDLPPDLAQLLSIAQLIGTRPKTGAVG